MGTIATINGVTPSNFASMDSKAKADISTIDGQGFPVSGTYMTFDYAYMYYYSNGTAVGPTENYIDTDYHWYATDSGEVDITGLDPSEYIGSSYQEPTVGTNSTGNIIYSDINFYDIVSDDFIDSYQIVQYNF